MKFGGTSMGSAERVKVGARVVAEEQKKRPVVVVVWALSKITDLLLDTMRQAEAGNRAAVDASLGALRRRHEETCRELLPAEKQAAVEARIGELIGEFERIVNGMAMLGERPPRSVDEADQGRELLRENDFPFAESVVLAVEINSSEDLSRLMAALLEAEININSLYVFIPHPQGKSILAMSLDRNIVGWG